MPNFYEIIKGRLAAFNRANKRVGVVAPPSHPKYFKSHRFLQFILESDIRNL